MVDRLVHHAEVIVLKGELQAPGQAPGGADRREGALTCSVFSRRFLLRFQAALTAPTPFPTTYKGIKGKRDGAPTRDREPPRFLGS